MQAYINANICPLTLFWIFQKCTSVARHTEFTFVIYCPISIRLCGKNNLKVVGTFEMDSAANLNSFIMSFFSNSGGYIHPLSTPSPSSTRMVKVNNWNKKMNGTAIVAWKSFQEYVGFNKISRSLLTIRSHGFFSWLASYTHANK